MSQEDDTYSTMFTALKHPIRRKILHILNQTPTTYTDIQTQLGIDNGLLNYHLDNMRELIRKGEDGKYRLSEFGEAAQSLTTRVESPVKRRSSSLSFFGHSTGGVLALGLIFLLLLSNAYLLFTVQSQSAERANAIGASLIQTRGLVVESVDALNTTVSRGDLGGADLYALYGDLRQAASQCDSLSRLDTVHASYWTRMSTALMSLSVFTKQLSQQTSYGLMVNSSDSTSLSWLKVDCLASIRDDLIVVLRAFPRDVSTGSSPLAQLDGRSLSNAADSSSKLISDVEYARSAFHLGEPMTVVWVNGSDSILPSVFNVTMLEVNGTYLMYANSPGAIR